MPTPQDDLRRDRTPESEFVVAIGLHPDSRHGCFADDEKLAAGRPTPEQGVLTSIIGSGESSLEEVGHDPTGRTGEGDA